MNPHEVKGFTIKELIGEGGFGSVYLADQPSVRREVAIKVILPEFANQPSFIRRFETEAQLVARLEHPHIVPLYDYWREPQGAYLVMRLLRGGSLHKLIKSGLSDIALSLRLIDQMAAALSFAHQHGVVHGDLKPANILLDADYNAYLSDFGIAKDLHHARIEGEESEKDTAVIGSVGYISPEQITDNQLTPLSDIYAFGLIIFEMLAGTHPFKVDNLAALFSNHLYSIIPPINRFRADLPTSLDPILSRATAKIPQERYSNALEISLALHKILAGDSYSQILRYSGGVASSTAQITKLKLLNPYKGLHAFTSADADDFFGRTQLTRLLLDRLKENDPWHRFLAVVGPSGSGKSSIIRAGILPTIRRGYLPNSENWFITEMTPSNTPLEELTIALKQVAVNPEVDVLALLKSGRGGLVEAVKQCLNGQETQIVLMIDQFEETFTLAQSSIETIQQFLDLLYEAITTPDCPLYVILSLRADFYDRPLAYVNFSQLMRRRTEIVVPLTKEELEEAILQPALRVGVEVEHPLVAAIVTDVSNQPGALPMLQYALTELFERRTSDLLTLEAYRSISGVLGALARRADEVFETLTDAQQRLAQQIFLRLVTLGEGAEDTRRRAKLSELIALNREQTQFILDAFGKYRLLSFDHDPETREPTVEVAHEALIRAWGRLGVWLNDSRQDIRMQRMLAVIAHDWAATQRDTGYLLVGLRLTQFEEWANISGVALTETEQAFLHASVTAREEQQRLEQERQARELRLAQEAIEAEKRRVRQLRVFVRLLAVGGIILLGVAALAGWLGILSRQNAEESELRAEIAQALAISAQADLESRGNFPERSILLALVALRDYPYTWQAERALTQAILNNQLDWVINQSSPLSFANFSTDGKKVLTADESGTLRLWNKDSRELEVSFSASETELTLANFSPDQTYILTSGLDGVVRVWDAETQTLIQENAHQSVVYSAAFSPDSRFVASISNEGNLRIWQVADGQILWDFSDPRLRSSRSLAFSPDGQTVLTTSAGNLDIWDIASQTEKLHLEHPSGDVNSAAFSPDGGLIVAANTDNTITLWSVENGQPLLTLTGHTAPVNMATFSPDGLYLVSAGDDHTARVWNAQTGAELYRLLGHSASIRSALFDANGEHIITASLDQTARIWNTSTGLAGKILGTGHTQNGSVIAFSPDNTRLVSGSWDRTVKVWNIETGEEIFNLSNEGWVYSLAYSPNGEFIISVTRDGLAFLWDAQTGELRLTYAEHSSTVDSVAISPDNRWAATGGADGKVHIWDTQTGETAYVFSQHTASVRGLTFTADGNRVISAGFDGKIYLWDRTDGTIKTTWTGHEGGITDLDYIGNLIATAGVDQTVRLWDVESEKLLFTFLGHTDVVNAVAFSPSGNRLASSSDDSTIRIWDLPSRKPMITFQGNAQDINDAAFNSSGTLLAAIQDDGAVKIWNVWEDVSELELFAQTCCVFRNLTPAEQQLFGLEPK